MSNPLTARPGEANLVLRMGGGSPLTPLLALEDRPF